MIVPVVGQTPGRRYGHTLAFSKPYLIVFGGNTGTEPVSDVWSLNVDRAPFSWVKLETESTEPCVRVYHSAGLCNTGSASGMMVVFGGRTADQSALKDSWGLRRHRNGKWDWVKAPYKPGTHEPLARY
jgi:protein phosphatase